MFHLVNCGAIKWNDIPAEYRNIQFFVKEGVQGNMASTWPQLAQPDYTDGDNNGDEVEEQLILMTGDEPNDQSDQADPSPPSISTESEPSSSARAATAAPPVRPRRRTCLPPAARAGARQPRPRVVRSKDLGDRFLASLRWLPKFLSGFLDFTVEPRQTLHIELPSSAQTFDDMLL